MMYADVLAANFRAARARAGLDQETVAARMRALGFTEWRYQTAGVIEKGKRRITAEEIMALAWVLETSIHALMKPPDELGEVRFRSGDLISARSAALLTSAYNDGAVTWDGTRPDFTPDRGEVSALIMITPRIPAPPGSSPAPGEE